MHQPQLTVERLVANSADVRLYPTGSTDAPVPWESARRPFGGIGFHMKSSRRYLLISPCRDETQYLRRTLDRVAGQSVIPALWVVVDDGSTDETPAILEEYARRLPYLRVVRRADRGRRQVGPGVIAAFYAGLETVSLEDFE